MECHILSICVVYTHRYRRSGEAWADLNHKFLVEVL